MKHLRTIFIVSLIFSGAFWVVNRYSLHLDSQQMTQNKRTRLHASMGAIRLPQARPKEFSAASQVRRSDQNFDPQEVADLYIQEMRADLGIMSYHHIVPSGTSRSPLGTKVQYQIRQGEIPIQGYKLTINVDRFGNVDEEKTQLKYEAVEEVDTQWEEYLSGEELYADLNESGDFKADESHGLRQVIFVAPQTKVPEMAFVIHGHDERRKTNIQVMVRATDGQILRKYYPRKEFHGSGH